MCTHLALRNFVYERFEFLVYLVDPCGGVSERLACLGDVRVHLFYVVDGYLVTEAMIQLIKWTDQAPGLPCAFLSVESSRSRLASAAPPSVSIYSPEKINR